MSEIAPQGRVARVEFTGDRGELFGLLFRGFLLMIPTIGIYRFWLQTAKRRFYWRNTVIDGDPLEYTGHAIQLLLGFLFALAFFLPIYLGVFYLSTQASQVVVLGYAGIAVVLWFLSGYAIYRGRDFRLSRTMWRGIRFDQKGSAWGYAWRRFGWSVLMIVTVGLVYPFMVGNLFRYRYSNSWYGDRQFTFHGSWKTVAGPFYLVYFGVAFFVGITIAYFFGEGGVVERGSTYIVRPEVWLAGFFAALTLFVGIYYYKSRVTTRMFSAVAIGEARASVRVRARSLLGQLALYCLAVAGAGLVVLAIVGMLMGSVTATIMADGHFDAADFGGMIATSWVSVVLLIFGYLSVLAVFAILGDVILGFGFWALVARGATITNPDSLRSVRAAPEDPSLIGEGLADALNVGAY